MTRISTFIAAPKTFLGQFQTINPARSPVAIPRLSLEMIKTKPKAPKLSRETNDPEVKAGITTEADIKTALGHRDTHRASVNLEAHRRATILTAISMLAEAARRVVNDLMAMVVEAVVEELLQLSSWGFSEAWPPAKVLYI